MALFHCQGISPVAGGSSEQGNARAIVSGIITGRSGLNKLTRSTTPRKEVPSTKVVLFPIHFNPFTDSVSIVNRVTYTDSSGRYQFEHVPYDTYSLYAHDTITGHRLLRQPIVVETRRVDLGNDTIKPQGQLIIELPPELQDSTVSIYIEGTPIHNTSSGKSSVHLEAVPSGLLSIHSWPKRFGANSTNIANTFVSPEETVRIPYKNAPPVFTTDGRSDSVTITAGTQYLDTLTATDPDDDTIIYNLIKSPQNMAIDSQSGIITWNTNDTDTGTYAIEAIATDSWDTMDTLKWNVHIIERTPTPSSPQGIIFGEIDSSYLFSIDSVGCSTGSRSLYRISWGDGDTSVWDTVRTIGHTWIRSDTFNTMAQAWCPDYGKSQWSAPSVIIIRPPHTVPQLQTPQGPSTIHLDTTTHTYTTHDALSSRWYSLEYLFDWGDGTTSAWRSDTLARHRWTQAGEFGVRCKARVISDTTIVGPWSPSLLVRVTP